MSNLIPINHDNERHTTSARSLWEYLDKPWGEFLKWFNQFKDYGFTEGNDYRVIECLSENPKGGRPAIDYEITIDMAKELCMLQKTEKGKQARQYFLELEKQWNSPEMIMARGMKAASVKLLEYENKVIYLQGHVETLETENKLLAKENLEWADRKVIDALVRKYGAKVGFESAWREFKKELLYNHSININSRITYWRNETGRKTGPRTLEMIHDEEIPDAISTAVSLCRSNDIDISDIIRKYKVA